MLECARKKSFYDDHRPFGLGCIIGFPSKQCIMKMIKSEIALRNLHILSISVFVYAS